MERKAALYVQSRQHVDGSVERFSRRWEGTLGPGAEGLLLRYREEAGLSSLLFAKDRVELRREGGFLLFCAGASCPGRYAGPCGPLPLTVCTSYLRHDMTMEGGRALLRYRLLADGGSLGEFVLTIQVRT